MPRNISPMRLAVEEALTALGGGAKPAAVVEWIKTYKKFDVSPRTVSTYAAAFRFRNKGAIQPGKRPLTSNPIILAFKKLGWNTDYKTVAEEVFRETGKRVTTGNVSTTLARYRIRYADVLTDVNAGTVTDLIRAAVAKYGLETVLAAVAEVQLEAITYVI